MTDTSRYAAPRVPVEGAQPELERAHRKRIVEIVMAFASGALGPLLIGISFALVYRESALQKYILGAGLERAFSFVIVFVIVFAGALPAWPWARRVWWWQYFAYVAGIISCVFAAVLLSGGKVQVLLRDLVAPETGLLFVAALAAFFTMGRLRHRAARA